MKLQTRFLLLILAVFVVVTGFVLVQRSLEIERSNRVLNTTLEERKTSLDTSLESEGELFKTLSKDYSFWDEMVDFVKTGNKEFASNNLETGLETYKADNIWIFNPAGKLVYAKNSGTENAINSIPIPPDLFTKLNNDKFVHYYLQLPEGTYEVRAATIVPGDDPDHNSAASGYLVIGRFLGDSFIEKMKALTRTNVEFESPTESGADVANGESVSFTVPFKDFQDQTVQLLKSESEVAVVKELNTSYNKQLVLFAITGILLLIIILGSLWWFVLRPIQLISTSIKAKKPNMLDKMAKSHSQFGELAAVVQEFFKQKLKIQESEEKRAELEQLNEEKTAFLSAAAHELKAPGTIISLVSESLAKNAATGKRPKELGEEVDTINHQAKKMTALVGDLRSAAEGKKAEERAANEFDFDSFLKREVDELNYVIEQKLVLTGSTKKKISADELRLGQVVSNLIRNAAKYSPTDKEIEVKSSVKDNNIIVEFADHGVGISEADQKHLFEKYFRSQSVKSKIEGLGLGLSICHEIIDSMGGKIWVESKLGHGSQFYISLPLSKLKPKS